MKSLVILVLCITLLTSSCKKEDVLTEGERTAQQVQDFLSRNTSIKTATFYISNVISEQNQSFTIDGQYIRTSNSIYNLSRLIRYQYFNQGPNQAIIFYF